MTRELGTCRIQTRSPFRDIAGRIVRCVAVHDCESLVERRNFLSAALASWFVCGFSEWDRSVSVRLVQRHDEGRTFVVGNRHRVAGCHQIVGERGAHIVDVADLKSGQIDPINVAFHARNDTDAHRTPESCTNSAKRTNEVGSLSSVISFGAKRT
jgi:hypothetical protein